MIEGQAKNGLVSIVTPFYDAMYFLSHTIKSVQNQTYENWELILVDDKSNDDSVNIVKRAQKTDKRIKLIQLESNSGVALARNAGIDHATGRYIAFLDADDFWTPDKLSSQIEYMRADGGVFSFTGYEFTSANGTPNGVAVSVPSKVSLVDYLKNNIIWTSTVILDMEKISKQDVYMQNLSYGEDALAWIRLLSLHEGASGLNRVLSYYRRTAGSLSANKLAILTKKFWLYMGMREISIVHRMYYFVLSLFYATKKRI
jgi:teichuronic acid biosynthesis glycosyltransferase TuaG